LFAVPPSLVRQANHLFGGYRISYTLGCGNGALPATPTRLSPFGLRLPGPFSFRFRRRLTPAPTLCAWLETYYSCSQPFELFSCGKDYSGSESALSTGRWGEPAIAVGCSQARSRSLGLCSRWPSLLLLQGLLKDSTIESLVSFPRSLSS